MKTHKLPYGLLKAGFTCGMNGYRIERRRKPRTQAEPAKANDQIGPAVYPAGPQDVTELPRVTQQV